MDLAIADGLRSRGWRSGVEGRGACQQWYVCMGVGMSAVEEEKIQRSNKQALARGKQREIESRTGAGEAGVLLLPLLLWHCGTVCSHLVQPREGQTQPAQARLTSACGLVICIVRARSSTHPWHYRFGGAQRERHKPLRVQGDALYAKLALRA